MAQIELEHITKVFAGGTVAVEDVNLRVEDGEFMVLVGPSGCGKSTLLRMIAGLEDVSDGHIRVGGRDVTDLAPRRRDVAMVFQSYALYPHMSVRQNIGYGLKVRKTPKAETKRRVEEVAALLGLDEVHRRRADECGDEEVVRARVQLGGAVALQDVAVPHDRDTLAQRHRLGLVVRDVDRRHAEPRVELGERGAHADAQLRVEVRERLIH